MSNQYREEIRALVEGARAGEYEDANELRDAVRTISKAYRKSMSQVYNTMSIVIEGVA